MPSIYLTNDEVYEMVKLYNHLRDIDMIDDFPLDVEIAFDKIQASEVTAWASMKSFTSGWINVPLK